MTALSEKFFKPRKVFVNQELSLAEFYQKVQVILNDHKIFVSNKMFAEQWDLCKQNSGSIKVLIPRSNQVLYGMAYNNAQGDFRVMFCVDAEKQGEKKIQLLMLKTRKVYYKAQNRRFQDSVYLGRVKEKALLENNLFI